jgi:hypothetical protein
MMYLSYAIKKMLKGNFYKCKTCRALIKNKEFKKFNGECHRCYWW